MTLKLGEYTVTIGAVKDHYSNGMIDDTRSFLCGLACQLWEAETRYRELGLPHLANRANTYAYAIHDELEEVGYLKEVE